MAKGVLGAYASEEAGSQLMPFAAGPAERLFGARRGLPEGVMNERGISRNTQAPNLSSDMQFHEMNGGAKRLVKALETGEAPLGNGVHTDDLAQASKWYGKEVGVAQDVNTGKLRAVMGNEESLNPKSLGDNEVWVAHTHPVEVTNRGNYEDDHGHFGIDVNAKQAATANGRAIEGARPEAVIDWSGDITHFNDKGVFPPGEVPGSPINDHGYIVGHDNFGSGGATEGRGFGNTDADARFMTRSSDPPPMTQAQRDAIAQSDASAPLNETPAQRDERLRPMRAQRYADMVNSDTDWRWADHFNSDTIPRSEQMQIRQQAIDQNLVPNIPVTTVNTPLGPRKYADFSSVVRTNAQGEPIEFQTPQQWTDPDTGVTHNDMWHQKDSVQFKYANWRATQMDPAYTEEGSTWHHHEGGGVDHGPAGQGRPDGTMQQVPYGTHRIYNHDGGRKEGNWAEGPR